MLGLRGKSRAELKPSRFRECLRAEEAQADGVLAKTEAASTIFSLAPVAARSFVDLR
jgi:hypothetical protein